MKTLRMVGKSALVVLLIVILSGLTWAAVDSLYQDAHERALAQSEYLIQYERIDSLDTLIARLTAFQFGGLPPLPGAEPWEHSEGPLPVDWENFPKELQDGLIGYWEGNVPVYDLHIWQDPQTREIVIQNSDFVEIYSLPCPYAEYCKPETYALYLRADLYSGKYTQQEIADFIAERDPARVGLHVTLVPTANIFDYLYAQASQQSFLEALVAQGSGGSHMMMSQGGGSGPLNDLDGDGVPNRDEIMAGTDPEDANDFFRITAFQLDTNNNSTILITWPSVSNREYSVQNATGDTALLSPQNWGALTQWLPGVNGDIVFTQDLSTLTVTTSFHHVQVRQTDANGNGLPDWWEIEHFGGLTNILASGDEDGDGLDNLEEVYYGYDPNQDERDVYHSIFYVVNVNTNNPAGMDDGTECFDFHGGGRPLSLASNASDAGYVKFTDDGASGGIFFNNDQDSLYVGIRGSHVGSDNAVFVFIDTGSGGVTNLRHLSTSSQPYGFSRFTNLNFHATEFTPNVGLLLGSSFGDGQNFPDFGIGGKNFGQGVYDLIDNSNFGSFTTSEGNPISQWGTNDLDNAHKGIEVALLLSDLGVDPGDTIKVMVLVAGGDDGSNPNARFIASEAYGKSISASGFNSSTIVGSDVQLADANQTLPYNSYPGFTDDDVMFQAFYWDVPPQTWWTNLIAKVPTLAEAGFTITWLPPPYKAANAGFSVGYDPFDHYDLGEFTQKFSVATRYGFKSELTNLLAKLIATNITPICDIVLNHMAGGSGGDFKTFDYPHDTFEKSTSDFHPSTEGHNDELYPYHNNNLFGDTNDHPFDVSFLAPNMRLGLKQWGNWLVVSNRFAGFRFDFTEGVEPWFVWEWLNYHGQRPLFGFMEYWKDSDANDMREWLDLTGREAAIYDWNLQLILEEMAEDDGTNFDMNRLKAPSLLGIEPDYTVTFVENHDTLQPDGTNTTAEHQGVAKEKELGYAYILHSQGLPLVFYRDYFLEPYFNVTNGTHFGPNLKVRIDRLIEIRKATVSGGVQYLNTNANLFIQQRDGGVTKPGSILVLNDHASSTLSDSVATRYTNTVLIDLVATNSPHSVTTDVNGVVSLSALPRDYRVYGLTNSLSQ